MRHGGVAIRRVNRVPFSCGWCVRRFELTLLRMKLLRTAKERLIFHLSRREKHVLCDVLKLYPRIPPAHQPLSKAARLPDQEASQRLLDEALAEQRAENKKHLLAWLADPRRFEEDQTGCRLSLSASEIEWLLQVLNDIRVGSWVRLGSPEEKLEAAALNNQTAPDFWAMEMSGFFQMNILEAVGGRDA